MNFETAAHRTAYEKVVKLMREIFGEQVMVRDDAPVMAVVAGSALVQIGVEPWGKDSATVMALAYVVQGAEPTPDLMRYLLHESDNMRFGGFTLDKDDDIVFRQRVVAGPTLDKEELKATVFSVAYTADEYDDKIVARFGGQRALERMR